MRQKGFVGIIVLAFLLLIGLSFFLIYKPKQINKTLDSTTGLTPTPKIEITNTPTKANNIYSSISNLPEGKLIRNDIFGFELKYQESNEYMVDEAESEGKTWTPQPRNFDYILQLTFKLNNPPPNSMFNWGGLSIAVSKNSNNLDFIDLSQVEKFVENQMLYGEDRKFDSIRVINKWNKKVFELYINGKTEGGDRTFYVVQNRNYLITIDKYINVPNTINEYERILNPIINEIVFF